MKRWLAAAFAVFTLLLPIGLALSSFILWPFAAGTQVETDGKLTVDLSGASDGYLMIRGAQTASRYKLRIKFEDTTLTYTINSDGNYETYPLQFGSGTYAVSLYEATGKQKFASAGALKITAELKDEKAAFFIPSQMVHYEKDSPAVLLSDEICAGKSSDKEKFEAIRAYVLDNYKYDFIRTFSIETDTLPDIDYCIENKMGVYQDLAALTACMLRVQGIPTRFVAGYIDKTVHAWNVVILDGQEVLYDPAVEIGGVLGTTYSVERYY